MAARDVRAFASHDWGPDGANHRRVAEIVEGLQSRGLTIWFDENDMHGNILSAMCEGLDRADVILVFVTRAYLDKVERGGELDNVRREFMYAARTPEKLLAVRLDPDLPRQWGGPVGMVLGAHLHCNLAHDRSDAKIDDLARMIRACEERAKSARAPTNARLTKARGSWQAALHKTALAGRGCRAGRDAAGADGAGRRRGRGCPAAARRRDGLRHRACAGAATRRGVWPGAARGPRPNARRDRRAVRQHRRPRRRGSRSASENRAPGGGARDRPDGRTGRSHSSVSATPGAKRLVTPASGRHAAGSTDADSGSTNPESVHVWVFVS